MITTIEELINNLTTDEYLWIEKKAGLIAILSRKLLKESGEENIGSVYRIIEGNKVEQIDLEKVLEDVIDKIEKKVDKRDFLRYILKTTYPPQLVEVAKRLADSGIAGKVMPEHHCYSLIIPGGAGDEDIHLCLHG
ncbi:MAG: hypothetical protein MUO73_05605 [Thermoplasmata archaeon]|nr:hypothetical protein [Thermoplasmata archaeon]